MPRRNVAIFAVFVGRALRGRDDRPRRDRARARRRRARARSWSTSCCSEVGERQRRRIARASAARPAAHAPPGRSASPRRRAALAVQRADADERRAAKPEDGEHGRRRGQRHHDRAREQVAAEHPVRDVAAAVSSTVKISRTTAPARPYRTAPSTRRPRIGALLSVGRAPDPAGRPRGSAPRRRTRAGAAAVTSAAASRWPATMSLG